MRLSNVDGIDNNGDAKVGGIRKGKMNGWQLVVIVHSFWQLMKHCEIVEALLWLITVEWCGLTNIHDNVTLI